MAYWFLGGLALLVFLLLFGKWFVRANPAVLAQRIRRIGGYTLMTLAAIFLLAGRLPLAAMCGAGAAVLLGWRGFPAMGGMGAPGSMPGPSPGAASQVETEWLAMSLDHATGGLDGTVKQGEHAGRRLGELTQEQVVAIWTECRSRDAQSASLLETYLDRVYGTDWRGEGQQQQQEAPPPRRGDGRMSREEAHKVLGLEPGASPEQIKEAHHKLMLKVHPDQGGSDYLAAKLNEAKDVLLGR